MVKLFLDGGEFMWPILALLVVGLAFVIERFWTLTRASVNTRKFLSKIRVALEEGGDIIIMVHPDYQYTPKLIPAMASMIGNGLYHCVLGSRILGGYALKGGMPVWKYIANRFLTFVENVLIGAKLSEYHTGYRAFSSELLMKSRKRGWGSIGWDLNSG